MVLLRECHIRVDPRLLFLRHYWFFFNVAIVDEFKYLVMVLTEISIHCYANILGVISFLQKMDHPLQHKLFQLCHYFAVVLGF